MTGWIPTQGRTPSDPGKRYFVRYRNGYESQHTYTATQLIWTDRNSEWDVEFAREVK